MAPSRHDRCRPALEPLHLTIPFLHTVVLYGAFYLISTTKARATSTEFTAQGSGRAQYVVGVRGRLQRSTSVTGDELRMVARDGGCRGGGAPGRGCEEGLHGGGTVDDVEGTRPFRYTEIVKHRADTISLRFCLASREIYP